MGKPVAIGEMPIGQNSVAYCAEREGQATLPGYRCKQAQQCRSAFKRTVNPNRAPKGAPADNNQYG